MIRFFNWNFQFIYYVKYVFLTMFANDMRSTKVQYIHKKESIIIIGLIILVIITKKL